MAAISPARLQREAAALFETLADLDVFLRGLENLLDAYADRTVRADRSGRPSSLLPTFHVPKPVLRRLESGLAAFAVGSPGPAFTLAERLWAGSEAEYKYLSINLMGAIPDTYREQKAALVQGWVRETRDEGLLGALFAVGTQADLDAMLAMVEGDLEGEDSSQARALDNLQALIRHAEDDALPGIFRLLLRVVDQSRVVGSGRLLALIQSLAGRVPVETAFFLRQQYLVALRPENARLLRQCLPAFPDTVQEELRAVLRENPVE